MRCPACGERDTRVVDSRDLDDAATIRRRRECGTCTTRFTTYERVESARLTVVKRDGERQEFDRNKLASGLEKALTRRPVPAGAADAAADAIEAELRAQGINEVESATVGQMAMERLRALDQIAYIRFASVYQSFDDLEQLKREVDTLYAARSDPAPGQTSLELVESTRGLSLPPIRRSSRR
jgi:transcriptional repressor NrdR